MKQPEANSKSEERYTFTLKVNGNVLTAKKRKFNKMVRLPAVVELDAFIGSWVGSVRKWKRIALSI